MESVARHVLWVTVTKKQVMPTRISKECGRFLVHTVILSA